MFEFDPAKSFSNMVKHGIDFKRARQLWSDENLLVIRSTVGSGDENRWLAIGTIDDKLWAAVFTTRANNIRIISLRRARIDETRLYENA